MWRNVLPIKKYKDFLGLFCVTLVQSVKYLKEESEIKLLSRVISGCSIRRTDRVYKCKQYLLVRCDTCEHADTFKALNFRSLLPAYVRN